ncbi:hypothetical protein NDA01_27995 [Trichocoleus desertorum AS-A10]|uniref:hypothetical protein n=1 Tax=Trichocoleus desertorum TaxID=1481672 RepID=UPI00329A0B11
MDLDQYRHSLLREQPLLLKSHKKTIAPASTKRGDRSRSSLHNSSVVLNNAQLSWNFNSLPAAPKNDSPAQEKAIVPCPTNAAIALTRKCVHLRYSDFDGTSTVLLRDQSS